MKAKTWIPVSIGAALVAAFAAYGWANARHAGIDPPPAASYATATNAADTWFDANVTVPAGTNLSLRLQSRLSTRTAHVGDPFLATVAGPIVMNGQVLVPEGATVDGHVAVCEEPGRDSERGRLQLVFDDLKYEGRSYRIDTQSPVYEGKPWREKNAALVGGATGDGGVPGGVVGGTDEDAAKGALAGGATGTAAALVLPGPHVEIEARSVLLVHLDRDVPVRPAKDAS